ncbi:aspartate/glutamate racemase family protein [Verticiella sediminum]|uniref:Aspartate/glutamate racemase family protein n=1 Tax=Verticiella sediminum TaxID=1247510 RepID=A0A556AGX8_9BURK|nr:amino acid racemase [Verticiella sediminum]TSH92144.1 aspartate/glutamate racemase family protein [Verticiella sediminum]
MSQAVVRRVAWRGSVGVLGGMGPMASGAFVCRLTELTPASYDQAHLPLLLLSDPRIPDRSAARLSGGPDPLGAMREGLRLLERQGVACIAIPCNTAHLWFDPLQDSVAVPILHIVEAVIGDLRRQALDGAPIGIMGTAATLALRLYQDPLQACGFDVIAPRDGHVQACSTAAIAAIKANRHDEAYGHARRGIDALVQLGACAVVLGCTELPLALPHARRGELPVPVTDSIDALARAVIEHMRLSHASPSGLSPGLIPAYCFDALDGE